MKMTKRAIALLLAVLMAVSMPLIAFADGADSNFTLTLDKSKLYAGISYNITAKITDVGASDASSYNAFNWSITSTSGNATINSKNNFDKVLNSDGTTYTVTESATFIMPAAGSQITITATYGSRTKTLSQIDGNDIVSLKPISSYDFSVTNTAHCYYDSNNNTIYLDRAPNDSIKYNADVDITNILPADNEDTITANVSNFDSNKYDLEDYGENGKTFKLRKNATGTGTLNFITESGKTPQFINVQCCVPTTKYNLRYKKSGSSSTTLLCEQRAENGKLNVDFPSNVAVEGKSFEITASDFSESSNDYIEYVLYNEDKTLAPSTYYTRNGNNCELNISVAGTYYLVCQNRSYGNAKLERTVGEVEIKIVVSQAYPIQKIEFFKLDENGNKTSEKLENIILYTNTSNETKTYNLEKSVTVTPVPNTDTVRYESSNASIATVNATTGLITAVKKGTTTVWAISNDNANAATPLTVEVRTGVSSITGISTTDGSTVIPSGHVKQFTAVTNPTNAEQPIYWSTSNPDVLEIDKDTGVATAKEVTSETTVMVIAATATNVDKKMPFTVVPAKRATNVAISVQGTSDAFDVDTSGAYPLYTDYSGKSFIVSAEATAQDGTASNDEFVWTISCDNGAGYTFDEAKTAGLITYSKSGNDYTITPLNTEPFTVVCTATTNVTAPQPNDPFDAAALKLKDTASEIRAVNESKGSTLSNEDTINIPVGGTVDITVKTSTIDNDKHVDPPVYVITAGADYINVTQRVSDDGEGITYTITGVKYSSTTPKIKFSSKSGSKGILLYFPVKNNIASAEVAGVENEVEYTGANITFAGLKLLVNGSTLDTGNYSVAYSNNINVGTATITFTGKGAYVGSVKVVTFEITPLSLANAEINAIDNQKLSSSTTEATPRPTVKVNGKTLSFDRDYTLSYDNNTRSGDATVHIIGKGNYKDSTSATFKVIDDISKATVSKISKKSFTGSAVTPKPTVTYYGRVLKENVDYTISYDNNVNVGTAKFTVNGMGYFNGSITGNTFDIVTDLSKGATIEDIPNQVLSPTVTKVTPSPVVRFNDRTLARDVDYTVSYSNNGKAGKATLTVKGTGTYYSGTISKTFSVIDDINVCSIASIPKKAYTGKNITPAVTVKYRGTKLKKGTDYVLTYWDNLNVGVAYVRIDGIGYFKGSVTKSFIIKPKKEKVKSLKAAKKGFTVKWAAHTNISGYQVQYALNKKFTKSKKTIGFDAYATEYTKSGLKAKKTYYVRVRSYRIIDNVKVYGAWSAAKKVKTKK